MNSYNCIKDTMTYKTDRAFTDLAHKAAINHYNEIEWVENNPPNIEHLDIYQGIDYVFDDSNGGKKNVQERFRKSEYSDFNEITIRYMRPNNYYPERRQSEYFKIEADYITYGYIDKTYKFKKFIIIKLDPILKRIANGDIIINTDTDSCGKPIQNKCAIDDSNLYAGFQLNKDDSSNFIGINPKKYLELWPEDRDELVVHHDGGFV